VLFSVMDFWCIFVLRMYGRKAQFCYVIPGFGYFLDTLYIYMDIWLCDFCLYICDEMVYTMNVECDAF
jgi:hypothetical protein